MIDLPFGFDYVLEQLIEMRQTVIFTSLLKAVVKDTEEQSDEEIQSAFTI